MKEKNELFEVILRKSELRVVVGNNLSSILWGRYWGIIHNIFESKEYLSAFDTVKIDLSKCFWADPIPLLSILLELVHLKQEYNKNIKIFLPRLGENNENNINFYKGQFLKFLSSQGFMKIMIDNFTVSDYRETLSMERVNKYANYNYKLYYNGADVIQAKIYNITDNYTREEIINNIEEELTFKFKNTVSLQTYNILIEQIYNILNELIENVERHAYKENEKKRFGLYIRKRYGAIKNYGTDNQSTKEHSDVLNREKKNCPALDNQILLDCEAILEIFFVDIGMGLKKSLKDYYINNFKKDYKYPVRELFYKVLKEGIRRDNVHALTPFGGLHFVARILRESKGYIWCNEGKEWIGANSVGLLREGRNDTKVALTENSKQLQNVGLIWCFRIPYSDLSKSKKSIGVVWTDTSQMHPVFHTYKELGRDMYVNRIFCRDDRYNNCILMNGDSMNWITFPQKENNEFGRYNGKIDTFVWFPEAYYSKNMIITLLKSYVETIINKVNLGKNNIYIVIGEIDSNELISFYYALNNICTNKLGTSSIKRIVLITKTWEVVCFDEENGYLRESLGISKNYFSYSSNNSIKIHENIKEYATMLRKYDSYLFWKFIKMNQKEKIYINSDVVWSGQTVIKGYLDFERIYLYEKLYVLLKNALQRTSGFVNNAEIEYRNIDYSSSRICQEINVEKVYSGYKTLYLINVGSACATGYTKEAYYKNNKVDVNVIFFPHPSFTKQLSDTAFLFIWPNKEYFDDFKKETERYYRLGKTNLITRNSEEMLIDTKNVYRNSIRSKKETYIDFQKKYPKFIKYGHYKTDKHHYLIGFDLLTYIKYSYFKKEGGFVYVLWRIINYLSEDEADKMYADLQDKEWIEVLQKCKFEKNPQKGEIVVYHSNTFTEYIIKLIKSILPEFMLEKIIPINIIEIQPKGTPITFSPFTLDLLKKIFSNNSKKGILYVDSSFSTGRKMLEIENILLSTGCENVTFLSVFDMRRLRNEDVKNFSYWKVNVPRLDDDTHCILCSVLKVLENFTNKVDKEMNLRIQEWFMNWQCMSITNSISGHGIEGVEGIQCSIDSIQLSDSNALNIFIAEKLCESYSNDYVYKFICQKTDLSIYLKIQLICTQICLYGNQNSRQLQLSLLSELIGNLAKSNIVNAYTSLAGIVLISQPESLIYDLLNEILYTNQKPKILSIKKYLIKSENMDLVIALGYFVKNYHTIEQIINGYESKYRSDSKLIGLINEHLLPEKDLKLLSKEFEGILINEQGRRHNTNIQKLLLDHVTDFNVLKERCQCVMNDINRMYELTKRFPISMANSRENISDRGNTISQIIVQIENLISQEEENYNKESILRQETKRFYISGELKSAIIQCEKLFEAILKSYFISYSEDTLNYFKDIISHYEQKYNKRIKYDITGSDSIKGLNKWYYWNRGIEKEFVYFLENLEHCVLNVSEEENVQMVLKIYFDFNSISVSLISWSDITADIVKNKFLSKNRLSKEQSLAFDVMFEFVNLQKNSEGYFMLETKMSIPACFQQLKGE